MSDLDNYFDDPFAEEGEPYDHMASTAAAARSVETMAAQQTTGRCHRADMRVGHVHAR